MGLGEEGVGVSEYSVWVCDGAAGRAEGVARGFACESCFELRCCSLWGCERITTVLVSAAVNTKKKCVCGAQ